MRIVSLLPSATEIVCALGAAGDLVGRSHECDFPASVASLPACTEPKVRVDGDSNEIHASVTEILRNDISVYRVHSELLRELRPDVIVTQVQCDVCAVSLRDVEASIASWMGVEGRPRIVALNPGTIDGILDDVASVAHAIGRDPCEVVSSMRSRMEAITVRPHRAGPRPRVATIEWLSPLMAAGNWIPELIEMAGGENLFGRAGEHSPWIDLETFIRADPDVIVVFPCGFSIDRTLADMPLLTSQAAWHELRAVRMGNVFVADGNQYFNRPGPRIVESLEILAEILDETTDDSLVEQRQGFRVVTAPASLRSAL
ncbi:MAG TPA: cobalamin-binding protein [Thermoanaerobaculia bacterium]|jgi:iron complex transport system substrate-binding protein|nr:cobalamin-binding protein [Thermoanaerobaculia bacterium]